MEVQKPCCAMLSTKKIFLQMILLRVAWRRIFQKHAPLDYKAKLIFKSI